MNSISTSQTTLVESRRRSLLWRIHFWAALIASPFAAVAALTGILYVFTPQIEAAWYASLDTVTPSGNLKPLDELISAARNSAPEGWRLRSVSPQQSRSDSVTVVFAPSPEVKQEGQAHSTHGAPVGVPAVSAASEPAPARTVSGGNRTPLVVYMNPYTATVLGSMPQSERFNIWARKLHSTLQQEGWRWIIELAASWIMVMLVTGVFLWWPRRQQAALPRSAARGRVAWKQWHGFTGASLGLMSAIMLTTGLTWSEYAGDQVRRLRDSIGQAPPRIPSATRSTVSGDGRMISWEQAWQTIRREAPDVAVQITPPRGPLGYWRANPLEGSNPLRRFDIALDAYSGNTLYYSSWDELTAFGKATAIGIRFHRGEFGIWNQALLLIFGAGVLFSLISGWGMYFKRRSRGLAGMPPLLRGAWKSVSPWAWAGGAFMLLAMPLLTLSSLGVLAAEAMLWLRLARSAR